MEIILICIISFFVTYFLTPRFIRMLKKEGIVGYDIHKKEREPIPEMGGPIVLIGFLSGIFTYIMIQVYAYNNYNLISLLAALLTVFLITFIGMFDDLETLAKKREKAKGLKEIKRAGLKQWQKLLLPLPAAVPLMIVRAGYPTMMIPLIGPVNFGIFYSLLIIPLFLTFTSNATNLLGGFNGLEAGMGCVICTSIGIYAYINGALFASVLSLSFASCLLAFLIFNKYPAKIFPGDSLNYAIGAVVGSVAIIGNIEKFAIYCFLPWIIEFILKARSKFKAECFGILQKDGTLKAPYKEIYSLTHIVMKMGKFKENDVTKILILSEVIVCAVAFGLMTL